MAGAGALKRRHLLQALACWAVLGPARALQPVLTPSTGPMLDAEQSKVFRNWMIRIIELQLSRGPSPRWQHRDCAGLVRFAVREALRTHDAKWLRANGMPVGALPPDVRLRPEQQGLGAVWQHVDGSKQAFVTALALVQQNSRYLGKEVSQAAPGDLLFFDQGDDQHLMVWTGRYIAYHTGTVSPTDNGLRAVTLQQLQQWKDTRWQPHGNNPNFIGVFRLAFLSR